ncbi:MAG: hypothetical protein GF307_03000 [candidate division Zixibacteria bacterium]|nr:hypothetical protein [candidate division Zixibacteria bacterium]
MKYLLIKILRMFLRRRKRGENDIRRILIIRLDKRLGNLVIATPLVKRTRKQFPESSIDVFAPGSFACLLDNNPHVDNVISFHHREYVTKPWKLLSLLVRLRRKSYELVLDPKDQFSTTVAIMSIIIDGNRVIGFDFPGSGLYHDELVEYPSPHDYEPLRQSRLLDGVAGSVNYADYPMRMYLDETEIDETLQWLKEKGIGEKQYIAMHCGGRGVKSYGVGNFMALAESIVEKYGIKIVMLYGPDEKEDIAEYSSTENIVFILPENIRRLAAVVDRSMLYIGGDTGPLHLAAALDIPTVSIFFASYWARYAPKGDKHRVYYKLGVPPDLETVMNLVDESLSDIGVSACGG